MPSKRTRVIRVPIPIDVRTVADTACGAFALATPIRVERLLALAVFEALGARAPRDKRERGVRRTLEAFSAGDFEIDVDGRCYGRLDDVVLCTGVATLRFYASGSYRSRSWISSP